MSDNPQFSILVVDDEKTNLDVLSEMLMPMYSVYLAKTGADAMSIANESRPDLILLDVVMPGMSGHDVLLELKNADATRGIPVIFISALDSIEDEERGLMLGAVDYIAKPFHGGIVKARVRTHLQIVEQFRRIERIGMVDALTNIPNRRSFDARMENEWRRAQRSGSPLAVLAMDIDKFKNYNDTYGHPQGDELLKAIARVFTLALKRPGDFVARTGGEEFIVVLPGTDTAGAMKIANDIRANVGAMVVPLLTDASPTSVTISVGAASTVPEESSLISGLIEVADKMLYQAKNTGRNKVCS